MNINKVILGSTGVLSGALMLSSGQVAAQSASAQAMLEEVVVTARRREESLQDLPLSIAAMSADAMEAQGILSIEDASDFVPNVTLTTSDRANNTRIVIRGIGGGHPDPVFVFGSGMYIDGHYIPNSLGGYMSTMDIERVELLRGPQGTLFGKNVTGGAVNIITAKPAPEFESSLTLRAAEGGQQDIRGMLNVPLSDSVFARFGIATETFDGYYFNRNLNIDQGAKDMDSINAALRWELNDNWTLDFNVNKIKRRDDNAPIQCNPFDGSAPSWGTSRGGFGREDHLSRNYYSDFDSFSQYEPGTRIPTATAVPLTNRAADGTGYATDHRAACASDAASGTFVTSSDHFHFSDLDVDSAFGSAQWDSDDGDSMFKINASYRQTDYDYLQDRDGSFYDIDNIGMPVWAVSTGGDIGQDNLTRGFEVLFEHQVNDRLDFTVGYNYFYELAKNGDGRCRRRFEESGFGDVGAPIDGVPQPVAGNSITDGVSCNDAISGLAFDLLPSQFLPFINSSRVENESSGLFGHLTYALNDNWTLDAGARWTEDDRNFWNLESGINGCDIEEINQGGTDMDVQNRTLGGPLATSPGGGLCQFSWDVTFESAILDGFYNQASDTFDEVTPMLSLTRNLEGGDVLDSGMFYVLYSEGFLTGGFNTEVNSNLPAIASFLSYQPENVTNYEVGFKGTFLDGRLQIMADYFFMDYANKQESIAVANPDGLLGVDETLGIVTNVASVDISGIEFELRASPWDGGFVSLDVGLLENEYAGFAYEDPLGSGGLIDESNTTIADLTADWTVNLGIEHAFMLSNGASITPRMNIYMSDDIDYRATDLNAPPSLCNQDSWTKVGARVTYLPPDGNWRASLFGQNITDEKIFEACTASRGVYRYRHERPAYWGLEFTMDWGG